MKGIDIYNGNNGVNLAQCKSEGVEFVILRGAFTGWGANRVKQKDACFEKFYAECKRLELPVGCYYYSCADSAARGKEEAEFLYKNCLKGKQFEFPIYIDIEDEHWQQNKKKGVTDAICAFCDYLESLGYVVGVYSNQYWFANNIDIERVKKYSIWLADYRAKKPKPKYAYDIWQTGYQTCAGKKLDADICYKDFEKAIKIAGANGFHKLGDIDGDGKVTAADARLALRAAVGKEKLNAVQKAAADMDFDGQITADDSRTILRKSVGKE